MKKIIVLGAMLLMTTGAFAFGDSVNVTTLPDVNTNMTTLGQQQRQGQQQQAQSDATNAGNNQTIVFEAVDNTAAQRAAGDADIAVALINGQTARDIAGTRIRNTPSVSGPQLTSSNDTCMGSTSGSVNAPGIGIGFGTTWTDDNCKMLKNSRELWNMGMKGASLALMCNDALNREALEITGFECPQTAKARKANAPVAQAAANNEPTDPIVRNRMGLPALK